MGRRLNSPYSIRVREAKRTPEKKERRKELRQRPEQKEKEKVYAREYRKRSEVKYKSQARDKAKRALASGRLKRPGQCFLCGKLDTPLKDGRSGLRMDHYRGYDFPLEVRFVCIDCDAKQERDRGNTTALYKEVMDNGENKTISRR